MKNLKSFIDRRNHWMGLFGTTPYSFPLDQKTVDALGHALDSELSPENLHCDGEISAAEANAKYQFFAQVADELESYCRSNNLSMPTMYEL